MKIDSHQHFWRYSPDEYRWIRTPVLMDNFLPEDLVPLLTTCGFDGTVAVQARSTVTETQWLLDLAEQYPFIKGVVGWADLCAPDLRKHLSSFSSNPIFSGIRTGIQVDPDNSESVHEDFVRGMAILGEFDTTFDLLIRPAQLPLACTLVKKFPNQTFILDHIANPQIKERVIQPWEDDILKLASFTNVFCKVSGMVTRADHEHWRVDDFTPYLQVIFGAFGPQRLMIGSDWPVCTQAANYSETMGIVSAYIGNLTLNEREAVLGGTAVSAYRLR